MATRLYFHNATNGLSGTFPSGKQSALTQSYAATGATTLKTMDTTVGVAQASMAGASLAVTTAQNGFYGFFTSPAFSGSQNVGGGSQTVTLNIANQENNLFMNIGTNLTACIYVWRPSTGAVVGTVCANLALTGPVEPGGTNERTNIGTTTATSTVAASAGDVLICEIWQTHTQTTATSRTGTFYYDGTTTTTTNNTVVTNHASFLDFSSDTMSFGATPVGGTMAITLDNVALSAVGQTVVAGTMAITVADVALSAIGQTVVAGQMSLTMDDVALSAAGTISSGASADGTLSITLDDVALSALGSTVVSGAMSVTLDDVTLSALGSTVVTGGLSITLADVALSALGNMEVAGQMSITLDNITLSALGSTIVEGGLNATLENVGLSAVGNVAGGDANGTLAIVLDDVTLSALGNIVSNLPQGGSGGGGGGGRIPDKSSNRDLKKLFNEPYSSPDPALPKIQLAPTELPPEEDLTFILLLSEL